MITWNYRPEKQNRKDFILKTLKSAGIQLHECATLFSAEMYMAKYQSFCEEESYTGELDLSPRTMVYEHWTSGLEDLVEDIELWVEEE